LKILVAASINDAVRRVQETTKEKWLMSLAASNASWLQDLFRFNFNCYCSDKYPIKSSGGQLGAKFARAIYLIQTMVFKVFFDLNVAPRLH